MGEARRRAALVGAGTGPGAADTRAVDALLSQAKAHIGKLLAEQRFDEATRHADQAIAAAPVDAGSWFLLALARRGGGDARGAVEAFQRSLELAPAVAETHYQLGATLEALEDPTAAETRYRAALKLHPGMVNAHCGLARALYARGALEEAMAAQRFAVALEPRAIEDGVIGFASPSEASPAFSRETAAAALEACRGHEAPGEDLAALVAERDIHIIDDFEPDFAAARAFALRQRFLDPMNDRRGGELVNFPGRQTRTVHATQAQMQRIADALGRGIMWHAPTHGVFRLSFAHSLARSDIHVDEEVCRPMYAAVLYLSRPEDCVGGTSFWRHVESGWDRVPPDDVVRDSRWESFRAFQHQEILGEAQARPFDTLVARREPWQRVLEIPMRSNRLVVYRSDFFHAISQVFGRTPEEARLVQLFFIEPR